MKFNDLVNRMGYPMMVACVLLWVGWFFLPAIEINSVFGRAAEFSFSRFTGMSASRVNPGSSFGFWSVLGLLCIAAPWTAPWLRNQWARFLNLAPIAFVLLTYGHYQWKLFSAMSEMRNNAVLSSLAGDIAERMDDMLSFGIGHWVVVLSSLFIAVWGLWNYRKHDAVVPGTADSAHPYSESPQ